MKREEEFFFWNWNEKKQLKMGWKVFGARGGQRRERMAIIPNKRVIFD